MSNIDKTDPALIALDWGTTSLRAYVLNSTGNVLEKIRTSWYLENSR